MINAFQPRIWIVAGYNLRTFLQAYCSLLKNECFTTSSINFQTSTMLYFRRATKVSDTKLETYKFISKLDFKILSPPRLHENLITNRSKFESGCTCRAFHSKNNHRQRPLFDLVQLGSSLGIIEHTMLSYGLNMISYSHIFASTHPHQLHGACSGEGGGLPGVCSRSFWYRGGPDYGMSNVLAGSEKLAQITHSVCRFFTSPRT